MITKGYILGKSQNNKNKYLVRIPVFEAAGVKTSTNVSNTSIIECTLSYNPGTYDGLVEGDCVFIGFEDNYYSKPIILGKLYLGIDEQPAAYQYNVDLKVTNQAILPANTKIGSINFENVSSYFESINTSVDRLNLLELIKANKENVIYVAPHLPDNLTEINPETGFGIYNGRWFLIKSTLNGEIGKLYYINNTAATSVEVEMGKLKLTPVGNGNVTTNSGQFAWEEENGTVKLGLYNDVVLHLGEDSMYYGKASGSIAKGDVVQFAGFEGNHAIIKKAVPSEINVQPKLIMGIAKQDIANNDFGYVLAFGKLEAVDTKGYENGTLIWFNSASGTGQWTDVMPTAPNAKVLLAVVIRQESSGPENNGVILVRPTFEPKLEDLQNVLISGSVINNSILTYNSFLGVWQNSTNLTTSSVFINSVGELGKWNSFFGVLYEDPFSLDLSSISNWSSILNTREVRITIDAISESFDIVHKSSSGVTVQRQRYRSNPNVLNWTGVRSVSAGNSLIYLSSPTFYFEKAVIILERMDFPESFGTSWFNCRIYYVTDGYSDLVIEGPVKPEHLRIFSLGDEYPTVYTTINIEYLL